jgi:CheY-like chemotaxis protein
VGNLQGALDLIEGTGRLDGALLDINLQGARSYGVVESLRKRGVPCVFLSGYDEDIVPQEYRDIPFLQKPLSPERLAHALEELVE